MRIFALCLSILFWVANLSAQPFVVIVRHAEKTVSNDKDPDLSSAGLARAGVLAEMLKDSAIVAIFTSEFKRTVETAAPIAKSLGITPTIVLAKDTAALVGKLRTLEGNALVVGHGNTIPDLIKALGINAPINIPENDYTQVLVVTLGDKPALFRLRYPNESANFKGYDIKTNASPVGR
jgi:broad specificity phosphatase PhoE